MRRIKPNFINADSVGREMERARQAEALSNERGKRIAELEAQLTALRAALGFYASLEQYDMGDGGERARAALHGAPQGQGG